LESLRDSPRRTGYPVTFYIGDDVALGDDLRCKQQHPDILRNPALEHASRQAMIEKFFDTGAFQVPKEGTYGTGGRNVLRGPAYVTSDFAILKDFGITERTKIQFRAELSKHSTSEFRRSDNYMTSGDDSGRILGARPVRHPARLECSQLGRALVICISF
jgi:hypothetical protein